MYSGKQRIKKRKAVSDCPLEFVVCFGERESYKNVLDFHTYNGGGADCKGLCTVNA